MISWGAASPARIAATTFSTGVRSVSASPSGRTRERSDGRPTESRGSTVASPGPMMFRGRSLIAQSPFAIRASSATSEAHFVSRVTAHLPRRKFRVLAEFRR